MHGFLVVGNNRERVTEEVDELVGKLKARRIDFALTKIAEVRELIKLTRLGFGERTAVVIEGIDQATAEAQSALLKSLEEPARNVLYILTAKREEGVLETVSSRCEIVRVQGGRELNRESQKRAEAFLKLSPAERLVETTKIKGRDEAEEWVESLILVQREKLLAGEGEVSALEAMLVALHRIRANGNVALQLTAMVINL